MCCADKRWTSLFDRLGLGGSTSLNINCLLRCWNQYVQVLVLQLNAAICRACPGSSYCFNSRATGRRAVWHGSLTGNDPAHQVPSAGHHTDTSSATSKLYLVLCAPYNCLGPGSSQKPITSKPFMAPRHLKIHANLNLKSKPQILSLGPKLQRRLMGRLAMECRHS